jgi:hypothetical protein
MKFNIVHEYNVPADKLWQYNFDPECEAAVVKATGLQEFKVGESKDAGSVTVRRVHVIPNVVLPGAVKAVIGNTLGYTEEDRISKTAMQYDFTVTPDTLADKMHTSGVFKVEPLGPGRCKRTLAGEVNVKIFGVGKVLEKFVCDELEKSYATVAREQERWIKAKGSV